MIINERNIVQLDGGKTYKTEKLKNLIDTGHYFLVLKKLNSMITICSISSQADKWVKPEYENNIEIDNYWGTGLTKGSYVDVSTSGTIHENKVYKIKGTLNAIDFSKILKQYNITQQRQIIESFGIFNTGDPEYLDYTIDKNGMKHFLIEEEI